MGGWRAAIVGAFSVVAVRSLAWNFGHAGRTGERPQDYKREDHETGKSSIS
jgi:hypothetical protein